MLRRNASLAILCCILAYASVAQGIGWNQNAHYALVRSLAHGTAHVDRYRSETGDVAWYHGHYYSTKAPGLALLTLPMYVALEKSGALTLMARLPGARNSEVGALWTLGLFGCVLPAAVILLLVRRLGEELDPGYGAAAAVTVGLGSLLLPFATLFFDHVLSAALGFGAFAIAVLRRDLSWIAGVLAGLAIVCEYPLGLVAVAVGLYVLALGGARRALLYAMGAMIGVLPLVAYNWLAFGSPTHLSYKNAVLTGGASGHDVLGANSRGFFGVGWPSFHSAINLLFSHIGLLTLAPVAAAGVVGWLLRPRKAEAAVAIGLAVAFVIYNSGYFDPFGGFTPGPRFLIPVLPFLGVGLAPAYRRLPVLTLALALPSVVLMVAVTISAPLLAHDGLWFERIRNGHFLGHAVIQILPLCAFGLAALGTAARATLNARPLVTMRDASAASLAFTGWLCLAVFAHRLLDDPAWSRFASAALVSLVALAVATAAAAPLRSRRWPTVKPFSGRSPG